MRIKKCSPYNSALSLRNRAIIKKAKNYKVLTKSKGGGRSDEKKSMEEEKKNCVE
jgi:hypothetical protein